MSSSPSVLLFSFFYLYSIPLISFIIDVQRPLRIDFCCFVVVFVALRPMSTAMVIAGRSVHLTTLFPGQA